MSNLYKDVDFELSSIYEKFHNIYGVGMFMIMQVKLYKFDLLGDRQLPFVPLFPKLLNY